jgi:hypothetical protein
MGWITPVITWVAGNGIGFSDLNRIEGDLKYLREENKTINGTNTFSGSITQTSGVTSLKATTIFKGTDGDISKFYGSTLNGVRGAIYTSDSLGHSSFFSYDEDTATFVSAWIGHANVSAEALVIKPVEQRAILFGASDNLVDMFQAGVGQNISAGIGVGRMGFISSNDHFYISHKDLHNTTDFSMRIIGSTGATVLNSKDAVYINNLNTGVASFSGVEIIFSKIVTMNENVGIGVSPTTDKLRVENNLSGIFTGFFKNSSQFGNGMSVQAGSTASEFILRASNYLGVEKFNIDGAGHINPTTTPTSGTWTTSQTIPRGQYNVRLVEGTGSVRIEQNGNLIMKNQGQSAGQVNDSVGGSIFSDGTNTTVVLTGTASVSWWKF